MDKNTKNYKYDDHKKNQFRTYFKKNKSTQFGNVNNLLVRIENNLGYQLKIEDLKEKNFKWKNHINIGEKCIKLLDFYSNWKNLDALISSRPDLGKKKLSINQNTEDIEKLIIEDISNIILNFNERDKFIFRSHFGYSTKVLTLEKAAEELSKFDNKPKLTRERIRQLLFKIKKKIPTIRSIDKHQLTKFLLSKQESGFHKLFPSLDEKFTNTVSHKVTDTKGDRLTSFFETYCDVSENFFQTPERILKNEFNPNHLKEIFSETPSPIDYGNFKIKVMELFGYKEKIAEEAIKFMDEKKMIKISNNKIHPTTLRKNEEVAHIALKFPNGIFWKDIYEIMNASATKNNFSFEDRIMPDQAVNQNSLIWLCNKGTYKHIQSLDCKENSDLILKNVVDIFKNKKASVLKVIEIYNSFKKNTIMSDNELTFYELRTIIRNYGQKSGLFFAGRSSVDSVSLKQNFKYLTGKDNLFKIIKRAKTPLYEEDIEKMLLAKKTQYAGIIPLWADQLLKEKKVMRVGPKQWCELSESLKMCDINLLLDNLVKLFNFFDVVSVHYFTPYINEKMDLALSYYYYDSIFKIFSKEKNLYYYNTFLSKKNEKLTTRLIYEKYFEKKTNLKENIINLNKKYKIAVSKGQFINAIYMFK